MTSPVGSARVEITADARPLEEGLTKATMAAAKELTSRISSATEEVTRDLARVGKGGMPEIPQAARKATSSLDDISGAARKASDGLDDTTSSASKLDTASSKASSSTRDMSGSMSDLAKKAGTAAGALGGITSAIALIGESLGQLDLNNKLAAQLDLTTEEAERAGRIASDLYAGAWGESMEDVNVAVGAVASSIADLGTTSEAEVSALTATALDLANAFGTDVAESTQTVAQLIRNGLATDATEGFDLITAAYQRVPAAMREELPELINEYGTFFSSIGFSGQEAFGALVSAADGGSIAMDKVGDAVKEFGIRATDLGDQAAVDALEALGLAGEDIQNRLLAGGTTARDAFQQVIEELRGITDPAQQAANAAALFGTPLDDLDKTKIPAFLDGLAESGQAMEGFAGAAERTGETLNAGPMVALTSLARTVKQTLVDALSSAIGWLYDARDTFKELAIAIGPLVIGLGGYAAIMGTITAATRLWAGAQWLLNQAMNAHPIVKIITVIGLLVGAVIYAYRNFEGFRNIVDAAWQGIQAAISGAWGFIQPIFAAIGDWITGTLAPTVMGFWQGTIKPAFEGIGQIIKWVWDNVIVNIFKAYQFYIMEIIVPAVMWLWNNVITPAFNGIGQIIKWVWDNVIRPTWDLLRGGITTIADAATWLWRNVITPAWDGIGSLIRTVWDNVIRPAWDAMTGALDRLGGFFSTTVDGIRTVWDKLRGYLAKPINFLIGTVYNNGIRKAWNKVADFLPGVDAAAPLDLIPEYATGGPLRGPGSGTSDDILMWGSNGEHMVTANEVIRAGGHNILYAIRDMIKRGTPFTWDNGQIITELGRSNLERYGQAVRNKGFGNVQAEGLFAGLAPGFAEGGAIEPWMRQLKQGHDFARAQHGKPYQWAGPTGPGSSFDCCLIAGTMVYGPDGACPISEVRPGFRVYAFVEGRMVVSTVTAQWFSKRQKTFKVRTRSKAITGSANHPFMRLVKVASWHPVKNGRRGEAITDRWDTEWARLDELGRGDMLVVPKHMMTEPKPHPQLADGQPIDTDVAWLVGLFIGDGHATDRDIRICVYGDNRHRAEKIAKKLGASSTGHGEDYGLFAYGTGLARSFNELNQRRRSHEKRIPEDVWSWPPALQRAFLDGYCDADGHYPTNPSRHGQRTYASSSRSLVDEVRAMHMILGDRVSNVSTNQRTKPIMIKGKKVRNARPLHAFTVWSGKRGDGTAALERDNGGIREWIASNDFTLAPVLAIEDQGEQDTYDIEVEGAHNFIAGGVVVHNSGFMGSIAAAIQGSNPWQRYWATGSFGRAQRASGPQGFVAGLGPGFSIGVHDNPGGPGGGHTAGTLGPIPGVTGAVNVESGGSPSMVKYGIGAVGADNGQFPTKYHLPIGANGFFVTGGAGGGPSPTEQRGFLHRQITKAFDTILDPITGSIAAAIGSPPPQYYRIPPAYLEHGRDQAVEWMSGLVDGLGDSLSSTWQKASDVASGVVDAVNPFDDGGLAPGRGLLLKDVIRPERVLSPSQTQAFEEWMRAGSATVGIDRLLASSRAITDSLRVLVTEGDYDGRLAQYGIQEDHPLIAAVLSGRDSFARIADHVIAAIPHDLPAAIESGLDQITRLLAPGPNGWLDRIDVLDDAAREALDEVTGRGLITATNDLYDDRTFSSETTPFGPQIDALRDTLDTIAREILVPAAQAGLGALRDGRDPAAAWAEAGEVMGQRAAALVSDRLAAAGIDPERLRDDAARAARVVEVHLTQNITSPDARAAADQATDRLLELIGRR